MKRALAIWALLAAIGSSQVTVTTEHRLVPEVTSPFGVTLDGEYDAVLWWISTGDTKNGKSVTFEADPGDHIIRVYGLNWVDGRLQPTTMKGGRFLVVDEALKAMEDDGAWGTTVEKPKPKQEPAKPTIEDMEDVTPVEPKSPLKDYVIQMLTRDGCTACDEWLDTEQEIFLAQGAGVQLLKLNDPKSRLKTPQFRVAMKNDKGEIGKPTKWSTTIMRGAEFERHKAMLAKAK